MGHFFQVFKILFSCMCIFHVLCLNPLSMGFDCFHFTSQKMLHGLSHHFLQLSDAHLANNSYNQLFCGSIIFGGMMSLNPYHRLVVVLNIVLFPYLLNWIWHIGWNKGAKATLMKYEIFLSIVGILTFLPSIIFLSV